MRPVLAVTLAAMLACCACATAHAMEIDDLRIGFAPIAGRSFENSGELNVQAPVSGFSQQGQVAASTDAHQHRRTTLALRRSVGELRSGFGAPIWGIEIADDRLHEDQSVIHFSGRTYMLDLVAGWGWRIMPRWHVEQGLLLGLGKARWHQHIDQFFQDGTDWDDSANGFAYEYGFGIGSYYTVADHLQVGLDLRHVLTRSRARFIGSHDDGGGDIESVSYDAKFEVGGFTLSVSAGYRF
jgi:hypothetical protein